MRTTLEVGRDLKRGIDGFVIISILYVLSIMCYFANAISFGVIRVAGTQEASSCNTSPKWNFQCVRDIEIARLEKIDRMGIQAALYDDMRLGFDAAKETCTAYWATLSDDSD